MRMVTGIFLVVGFALVLVGLILILRAMGIVNRSSPFFTYRIRIGGVLIFVGDAVMVVSVII
jgi:hypothetical protein